MKNNKGITMTSLSIYVISFVIIIGIISSITVFFNSNSKEISKETASASEYNKFNLYMLEYTKGAYKIESTDAEGIKFTNGDKFVKKGNILYFNKIKLCENIDEFKVEKATAINGKEVLKTYIKINGTVYTTDYVIESN